MNRRLMLGIVAAALASTAPTTFAQDMKSVAGAYAPVKIPAFGEQPRGQMILTQDGRYSIVLSRAEMPKIASGTRTDATPEENKMVVNGSIAHTGRYSVDGMVCTANAPVIVPAGGDEGGSGRSRY